MPPLSKFEKIFPKSRVVPTIHLASLRLPLQQGGFFTGMYETIAQEKCRSILYEAGHEIDHPTVGTRGDVQPYVALALGQDTLENCRIRQDYSPRTGGVQEAVKLIELVS